ncbi:MAG: hypothetical protein IPH06_02700 [Alphaproteobacteria bacterium]|nr:hypothetical protein [Alphaproteobacteria bacterium]QQS56954.1 MAG: hypothetical protein IPN28_11955 [Alphaproteobacteria bacterium]
MKTDRRERAPAADRWPWVQLRQASRRFRGAKASDGLQTAHGWSWGDRGQLEGSPDCRSNGHPFAMRVSGEHGGFPEWRVSGASTLTSGFQGARKPLSDGCRESEVSRSWSSGDTLDGAVWLNAG